MEGRKYLLIIILVSVLIRLTYVLFLDDKKYYFKDTAHYYKAAINIVDNGTFNNGINQPKFKYRREPVYPIFMAGVIFLFGKSFLAIRILQSIIIALSGILFYKILINISSYKAALIGTFIYLCYPFYVFFSGYLGLESICLPLLIIFTYLCVKYLLSQNNNYFYGAALMLGILFHTRVTSIALFIPLILLPFLIEANLGLRWIKEIFISLIIVFIASTPWAIRNYNVLGKITIPYTKEDRSGEGTAQIRMNYWINQGIYKSLSSNFIDFFSPLLTKVKTNNRFNKNVFEIISFMSVLPLLMSTIILPFLKRNKYMILLYSFLLFYSLPYVILGGQTRYRLPVDFIMILFMTLLVEKIYTNFIRKDDRLIGISTCSSQRVNTD